MAFRNPLKAVFRFTIIRQVAFALLIMQVCRIVWTIFNRNLFAEAAPEEIIRAIFWGSFFDLPVLAYFYLPAWLWLLVYPGGNTAKPHITRIIFMICSLPVVLLNAIDTGYSQVTGRRSGPELFDTLADPANPITTYLVEYWWALLLLGGVGWLIHRFVPVGGSALYIYRNQERLKSVFRLMAVAGLWLVSARGGFHLKPMTPLHAGLYVPSELIIVTASTPLQVISISGGEEVPPGKFMDLNDAWKIARPVYETKAKPGKRPNVVLLIVESLGRDYTGFLNNKPYTPFLDTFSKRCLNFRYCYANGTRSIEMVPSLFCGMPGMIETHYLNSTYATNKMENAFSVFRRAGYQTAFFHGAANGTMSFQSFLNQTGKQLYFGLDQYPADSLKKHFDGSWGVFDEYYLNYFLGCCDTMRKPFFNAVFTLSSHHPYKVPEKYGNRFPEGKLPIHKSIRYSDYCLKLFFEQVRKYDWFNETIFIITGDHTSYGEEDYFYSISGHYEIPLLIYGADIQPGVSDKTVSQCDIVPTLMDMCGIGGRLFGFGRNMFDSTYNGHSLHKERGLYYIVRYPYSLGIDQHGQVRDYHEQFRNRKKGKPLPRTGPVYEELKSLLTSYVTIFCHAVRNNRWYDGAPGQPGG